MERGRWNWAKHKFEPYEGVDDAPIQFDQWTDTESEPVTEYRFRYRWREGDGSRQSANYPLVIPEDELKRLVREAVARGWIRKEWLA